MKLNKNIKQTFYLFLIPLILGVLVEWVFNGVTQNSFYNAIENSLFAIMLIITIGLFQGYKFSKFYRVTAFSIFVFCLYFETLYYYLFATSFSPSAIFVLLDSNLKEAKEFINFYLDLQAVLITVLFTVIYFITIFRLKKIELHFFNKSKRSYLIVWSLLIGTFLFLKTSTLIIYNLPYLVVRSNYKYYVESKKLGDYKQNINGNFNDVTQPKSKENELHVVIIGESTSRKHFGIYDYYRQTTPELYKIKDDLFIYRNVISPHVYSVGALTKILTLGNYENPEKTSHGSIIQLANKAEYNTFWLSNQRPIGPYESLITKISLSSKTSKFITTTIAGNSKVLDGKLFNEFDAALNDESSKKMIFLHLMGTHHDYQNRYPDNFNVFKDIPKTKFLSEESHSKINHYDNAVLYNDYIISQVIKKVQALNKKSFVLYFSDHGEEVYDDLDLSGHNEDIYSKNMYDVPFILWQSNALKKDKLIHIEENRKYMLDDLFYSIADLLSISAKQTDSTRSIFSEHFKERKRIIKGNLDYDKYFNVEH